MKDNSARLLKVIMIVGILLIVVTLCCYYYRFGTKYLSHQKEDWNLFAQYVGGVLGPIVGLLTLAITGWIAYEFNNYQKILQLERDSENAQQITIDLFKEFRSTVNVTARTNSWEVKKLWEKNENNYRKKFMAAFTKEEKVDNIDVKISVEQIQGLYDLFAFFQMLSLYNKSSKDIQRLRYFYFPLWRKFLYEVAIERDKGREIKMFTSLDPSLQTASFTK